ncbi:MAG: HEAT repeat domain-containing protein [Planctomycetes bacterium]|nr:HEAT repeat domain-containing protein [Planctomycetota bacterium]
MREALGSHQTTVRQSAILALGILEHRGSMPVLWEVMHDTGKGRQFLRSSGSVQSMERAFAALALGLVCGPEMAPQLRRMVERSDAEDVEVAAGAVLSLGLIPEAASDSVPFLAELLGDETLERRIRAQIPISLARLGAPAAAVVPQLFRAACDRGTDGAVRASCVIALGRLAYASDAEVVTGLRKLVQKDGDAQLRHFALVALGQIAANSMAVERRDKEGADAIVRHLSAEIAAPSHGVDLPWAVLAAGIAGNAYAEGAAEVSALVQELCGLFKSAGNPEDAGAMAIALGLLGAPESGALLLERFAESNDAAFKGHCAVALGLVGHRAAADALKEALFEHHDARLRVDAATGLGLMGDVEAANRLVEMLAAAPTFAVTGAVAQALGCIADRRAVHQLVLLVEDESRSSAVRGFSCVALGLIAEKTPLPWNAPLSINSNYASELAAQSEVLDIF